MICRRHGRPIQYAAYLYINRRVFFFSQTVSLDFHFSLFTRSQSGASTPFPRAGASARKKISRPGCEILLARLLRPARTEYTAQKVATKFGKRNLGRSAGMLTTRAAGKRAKLTDGVRNRRAAGAATATVRHLRRWSAGQSPVSPLIATVTGARPTYWQKESSMLGQSCIAVYCNISFSQAYNFRRGQSWRPWCLAPPAPSIATSRHCLITLIN